MLQIIVSADPEIRVQKRNNVLLLQKGAVISVDDMSASVSGLEQYIYPSLFSVESPVIHAKYLLEEYAHEITKELLQKLVQSSSIFILEERALATPLIKMAEKEGGIVHVEKTKASSKEPSTIFSVTNALTAPYKKDRWLAYQYARRDHAPEALIGILYWKLRDLMEKSPSQKKLFAQTYRALMRAHATAWKKGSSLDSAIEKVILEQ